MLISLILGMEENQFGSGEGQSTVIHFVETSPSALREMPMISLKEYKVSFPPFLLLSLSSPSESFPTSLSILSYPPYVFLLLPPSSFSPSSSHIPPPTFLFLHLSSPLLPPPHLSSFPPSSTFYLQPSISLSFPSLPPISLLLSVGCRARDEH